MAANESDAPQGVNRPAPCRRRWSYLGPTEPPRALLLLELPDDGEDRLPEVVPELGAERLVPPL